MISPEVTGATFPGRERAQITFRFSIAAALKSIPPGLEARSISSVFAGICSRTCASNSRVGMVLIMAS